MKTIIIAEAGVNHNGNINLAKKMVRAAANAGADIVKFQTFTAAETHTKKTKKATYQKKNTRKDKSLYEIIKKLELSKNDHFVLKNECKKNKIEFLSSPFDIKSIDLLNDLGVRRFKIPSGEINNLPFLKYIGKFNKKIILSSGMSTISEIRKAIQILKRSGTNKKKIVVLQCNTEYPTPFKDANLKAMLTIKRKLNIETGYSDHTEGIEIPIAAAALGAKVIEKHFTLNKKFKGPDHGSSIDHKELKLMIRSIRNIEKSIGNGVKSPTKSEIKNIKIARKSIVAKKNIKKGEKFSNENLTTKRPGTGISPMKWESFIGKKANKNYKLDELIKR